MKEVEMKEMVYGIERKIEVLYSGEYKGYKFSILNLGTHPTAYVEDKNLFSDYEEANRATDWIPHGGFTYQGKPFWNKSDDTVYLGWDYAHCGDYMGYYAYNSELIGLGDKQWSTAEIYENVKEVINSLLGLKERAND